MSNEDWPGISADDLDRALMRAGQLQLGGMSLMGSISMAAMEMTEEQDMQERHP